MLEMVRIPWEGKKEYVVCDICVQDAVCVNLFGECRTCEKKRIYTEKLERCLWKIYESLANFEAASRTEGLFPESYPLASMYASDLSFWAADLEFLLDHVSLQYGIDPNEAAGIMSFFCKKKEGEKI